ncbi:hypothetical protein [Paenibacillus planticolens]|uniref:Uncharacterized protein n=1 Tax=Paenibacillus planticolens TaxID=2654976 RepID=A0ABX1ZJU4_9BACL|nr:hypothetical protein [Paenibacillus planticolens]NOV00370.1 hypothetical protein [Paenibacillus planticolens]
MITVNTYIAKKFSIVKEQFNHLDVAYDNAFYLQHTSDCFVNIDDVRALEEMWRIKKPSRGKTGMVYISTAIIIEYNGQSILNFDHYHLNLWFEMLSVLDQFLKNKYGIENLYQNRLLLTLSADVDNQIRFQISNEENEIYTSKVLPEFELVSKLLAGAKKFFHTLINFDIYSIEDINELFEPLDHAFNQRYGYQY